MEIVSVEGFVVSSIKYGETSKILNILTKEYGIIGIISKGCLSLKSKNRIMSEKFTYAVFHIYYKKDKLGTLISADPINYLSNIKNDIINIGYLTYLTELVTNIYKQTPDVEIINIFISGILKINDGFNPKIITNIIEIKYLDYIGIALNLNSCVVCGNTSISSLSMEKGGYVCSKCITSEKIYDSSLLKMFKLYYYVDIDKISELNIKEKIINEIDIFLNTYYNQYSGLYIKSKSFLENLKSTNVT